MDQTKGGFSAVADQLLASAQETWLHVNVANTIPGANLTVAPSHPTDRFKKRKADRATIRAVAESLLMARTKLPYGVMFDAWVKFNRAGRATAIRTRIFRTDGEVITFEEPIEAFPSDELIARIMLVAK